MCSQEELLERIKEYPGITQQELKQYCGPESKPSVKLKSLRNKGLIVREPSTNVKMSWDIYPAVKC